MLLGTSGFGVIAVVSLLVTTAPGRIEIGEEDRGTTNSRIGVSRPVVSETDRIDPTRSGFVKIEHDRGYSSLRSETTAIPFSPYPQPTVVRSNDQNTQTPTKLSRFLIGLSTRASTLTRNSEIFSNYHPNDWSIGAVSSKNKKSWHDVRSKSPALEPFRARNFDEKLGFAESLESMDVGPLTVADSLFRNRLHSDRQRETSMPDGEVKFQDDKKSAATKLKATKKRRSSGPESVVTTNYQLPMVPVTFTTSRSGTSDLNFAHPSESTENYESQIIRNFRAIGATNGTIDDTNLTIDESILVNGTNESINESIIARTISRESKNSDISYYRHATDYPANEPFNASLPQITGTPHLDETNSRNQDAERFGVDSRTAKLTDYSTRANRSRVTGPKVLRQDSLLHDSAAINEEAFTRRTLNDVTVRKHETPLDSVIKEEIVRARRITQETFPDVSIMDSGTALRLGGNIDDTNDPDSRIRLLDNHKAIVPGSSRTTTKENEKQGNNASGSSSISSRIPEQLGLKDTRVVHNREISPNADKTGTSALAVNQITAGKSVYAMAKNNTQQSINFLDGKSKKIFYEIKPSVITDTDRLDDIDPPITTTIATTTRQSFDKFLLSSVPSVYGKFGPYFLDEEDRRNVTERIGSTVQLDCRIGFLGDRKVTWLHHYKDSFRLLTVKKESYSVDRRISLNFQYPNNWRLQIAYASLRDSGLYKCQVEIDPDKSLVKRYNVVITAPILTITDDSGRPVFGERHLKAGSALKLRCEARDVMQSLNESVLWMRGDETLTEDVSENRTSEIVDEREVTIVISTLFVERAAPTHAGNYSCAVPDKAKTTIAVHVLNGELPAAVQHGSGVSTAVLNIWLIHLTASYGFLR